MTSNRIGIHIKDLKLKGEKLEVDHAKIKARKPVNARYSKPKTRPARPGEVV